MPRPSAAALSLSELMGESDPSCYEVQTKAEGPPGSLPLTDEMLREWPSGDLFGLSQNAGMGWDPSTVDRDPFLILSTQGGFGPPTAHPWPWGIIPGTGRSACSFRRRPRRSGRSAWRPSPRRSPTRATAGPRARPE